MNRKNLVRSLIAASLVAVGTGAYAQADNSNSSTDPTYYGGWYYFNPAPRQNVEVWTYRDYSTPRWYVYGPTVTYQGPAYYDRWYYYNPPSNATAMGTITQPGYMGPRDVKP